MKEILLCFFLALSLHAANAQDKKQTTLIEGGLLTYGVATKELGFSFRGIHSKKVLPDLYVGLGTGYEKYMMNEVDGKAFKILPLFVQGKYVLNSEKSSSLFAALDLGYGMGMLNKEQQTEFEKTTHKGGMLASPQIGVVFNTKRRQEFITLSFGYKYQGFAEKRYYNSLWSIGTPIQDEMDSSPLQGYDNFTDSKYHLHRLSIMLGFGF
ncbi:hypothetical protein [Sphingobacterium composti Ten et al. 2007 non Yoo et al. 2007]|uniref:hypothetical protein n=1 Tax=Sphingobacterium composti TaxID=363260 RepID=UPI001356955A|nr:hypothetical protein [Sphingobacterium composti Ten et al. 2007 non Yoo et al. 2007]